jgi:uncharacterized membrane protein
VGNGAGASVNGNEVEVSSLGIIAVVFGATGVLNVLYVGVDVCVADGVIGCEVDTALGAGTHPDRIINATGRRTRRRVMVCTLGGGSEWKWV